MSAPEPRPQVSAEVRRRNMMTGALLAAIVVLVCLIAIARRTG